MRKWEPKKKPSVNKIDKMLALLFLTVLIFIAAMTRVFCVYGAVPDSLVVGFFAMSGGECGVLGWIKQSKERRRERQYELEDREYGKEQTESCNG